MGVDVAAAGSGVGSVVVIGEGDAWRPEARGAPSKVGSFVGLCPLVGSCVCYAFSSILLTLSLPLHRMGVHLLD